MLSDLENGKKMVKIVSLIRYWCSDDKWWYCYWFQHLGMPGYLPLQHHPVVECPHQHFKRFKFQSRTSYIIKGHPTLHKSLHLIEGKMLDPIYTWPSSLETCSETIRSVAEYLSVWTDGITIQRRQFCTWPSSLPSHLKVLKLPTNCPTGGTSHPLVNFSNSWFCKKMWEIHSFLIKKST